MSDLHRVRVLAVDAPARSCVLELECVNNSDQEVPLEPAFYANVLADLYLLTVPELGAPVAYLETAPGEGSVPARPGLSWMWRYARHYSDCGKEQLEAAQARLEVVLEDTGLDADEAWSEALDEQLEPALAQLKASYLERWRSQYDTDCARVELRVPSPAWVDFLVPEVVMKVVYGPYTTWDCL